MTPQSAEILSLEGLGWLASDADALDRFLAATGIDGAALRAGAGSRDMAQAVIGFLLANEELLLRFCQDTSTDPKALHLAAHVLERA